MVTQIENGAGLSGHEIAIFVPRATGATFVMRGLKYPT
jgi:hypothetical protein